MRGNAKKTEPSFNMIKSNVFLEFPKRLALNYLNSLSFRQKIVMLAGKKNRMTCSK